MVGHATQGQELSLPAELDSARAKLVYLYLAIKDEATADDICAALDIDKGSILAIISTLRERGYVTQQNGRYGIAA